MKAHTNQILNSPIIGYAHHRILLDNRGIPIDYEFIEVNPTFEKLTGLSADTIIGKTVKTVIPGIEKAEFDWIGFYGEIALNGGEKEFEQYSEPLKKWYRGHVFSPEKFFFTTLFVDITSSKAQTEEYEAFFSVNLDLLCIADIEGNFIKTNEAWSRILGYSTDDLNQRKFLEFVHPDDLESTLGAMAELGKGAEVLNFTNRYRCSDGSYRFIEWRSHPKGNLIYAAARDVTDRYISHERLEQAMSHSSMYVWEVDESGLFTFMGSGVESVLGYTPEELVGLKTCFDLLPIEQRDGAVAAFTELFKERISFEGYETINISKNGKKVWLSTSGMPVFNPDGTLKGYRGTDIDISNLKESQQQFESLVNNIPGITFRCKADKDWTMLFMATQVDTITGYSSEELIGNAVVSYGKLIHPDDQEPVARAVEAGIAGNAPWEIEYRVRHKDGSLHWVYEKGNAVKDEVGTVQYLDGFILDISEKKQAELYAQQLQQTSERQRKAFDQVAIAIAIHNDTNAILDAVCKQVGQTLMADRALVYDVDFEKEIIHGLSEWLNPKVPNITPSIGTYPLSVFKSGISEIRRTKQWLVSNHCTPHPTLCKDGSDKILHRDMSIKTLCWVPFQFTDKGYQLMVFNWVMQTTTLENEDYAYLQSITRLVELALNKIQVLEESQKQQKKIQFVYDSMGEGLYTLDEHGVITQINQAACQMLGYEAEELIGQVGHSLFHSHGGNQELPLSECPIFETIKKGEMYSGIETFRHKSGRILDVKVVSAPTLEIDGTRISVTSFSDITQQKKSEEENQRLQQQLQMVINNYPDGIIALYDRQFRFHLLEGRGLIAAGLSKEDIVGKKIGDLFPNEFSDLLEEKIEKAFNGVQETFEITLNGRIFSETVIPVKNKDGLIEFVLGVIQDITEQKQAEEKLKVSEDRYNRALSGAGAGLWDWDMVNNTVYLSEQWKKMLGYEDHEIPNDITSWRNLRHPDEVSYIEQKINDYLEGKTQIFELEHRLRTKDGTWRWILTRGEIERNSSGKPVRWTGTNVDLTDAKLVQEEILNSNERLKIAQKVGNIGSWEHDFITNSVTLSDQTYAIYEAEPSTFEVTFENIISHFHPDDRDTVIESLNNCIEEKKDLRIEHRIITARGNVRHVLEAGRILLNEQGDVVKIIGSVADITSEKEASKKIQESELKFRTLFETLPTGVTISDFDGNIIDSNPEANHILGLTPEQQKQRDIDGSEWKIIRPDGSLMPSSEYASVIALKENRTVLGVEMGVIRAKDDVAWILVNASPVEGLGIVISYQDISEIKKVQQELSEAKQLAETASKAKSEFLANMSHEIRTPLNGVIGFTELLKNTPLSSVQKTYLESAQTSGHTLLKIINDILDFSKIEAGMLSLEMIKTDVVELLENSVDMVKYQAGRKNLELLLHIDPALPRFAVTDPIRLKQMLANLLGNAVKFTDKGEVELKVQYEPHGANKGKLTFIVRDTGIGITEEQIKKLFKAFSQADTSTTRKFGGTGLGLIISQLIAKELGTSIEVESKPGEGSTFSFEITTEVEEGDPLERGGLEPMKRCLIIDDNATSRRTLEQMLAGWNIESESCDNGLAALKLLETSNPFDVILCDYYMPYIDGLETIQMIREQLKLTPEKQPVVLLHSSSDEAELHKKCDELGVRLRLTKPLKSQDLYLSLCNVNGTTQEFEEAAVSSERAAKSVSSNKVKILIAEDIKLNMTLIKALTLGMYPQAELHEAVNGVEAVRLRSEIKPDLIFMDVQMPELDGLEATRQIRDIEKETGDHVPIIALTAGAFKEEREKCMAAGMDDFLTKPVEIEKISSVIKKYTEV